MQPENYVVPDLTSLKPLSQAAFFFEAFKSTTLISPSYPNSQMFYAEGYTKPKSVGVDGGSVASSAEEYRVVNGIEESHFPQALESSAPFLKLEASVSRDRDHGVSVEDLGACSGLHPEKMNLGSSASYQKRFILFDQTGSTGRIIFHPTQYSMKEIDSPNMDRKEVITSSKLLPTEGNYLDWKAGCHENEETVVALAFAALQKTRASRWNSISLGNFGDELIPESVEGEVESTSRASYHVLRQEKAPSSYSEMHEDTEDLEALLSSDDDESSTGHSPSDITGNDGDNYVEEDLVDVTSCISVKRRRIDTRECVEDEVNLIPAPAKEPFEKLMINEKSLPHDISVVDTSSWEPVVVPEYLDNVEDKKSLENVEDGNYNDDLLCGHRSYGKSDECSSKISGNEQFQTFKRLTSISASCKKSRNENIKRTVEHLRSIIPGGNGMETAVVLDEAIQYVKALQQKVKRMEANQQGVME
ncbi:hypothetical protein SUGI_0183720 [Cryptomeria japonica]|nr:hypothetical protein SUGI_0183720 [Cryptomeria japonica]